MTLPSGITEDLLNQIWITSSWIQNFITNYPTYQQFGKGSVGLMMKEMLQRLQQEQTTKLFLYSGHDRYEKKKKDKKYKNIKQT